MPPREEIIRYDSNTHSLPRTPRLLNLIQPMLLPWRMKKKIDDELGGHDVKLVIEKKLVGSDLTSDGFLIPRNEILEEARDFLKPQELFKILNEPVLGLNVYLYDPNLKEFVFILKMTSVDKYLSTHATLTLTWGWPYLVHKNKLEEDELVQLWSFRDFNERLRFALVNLSRPKAS